MTQCCCHSASKHRAYLPLRAALWASSSSHLKRAHPSGGSLHTPFHLPLLKKCPSALNSRLQIPKSPETPPPDCLHSQPPALTAFPTQEHQVKLTHPASDSLSQEAPSPPVHQFHRFPSILGKSDSTGKPSPFATASPLHTNLQAANFQRCKCAFACPVT